MQKQKNREHHNMKRISMLLCLLLCITIASAQTDGSKRKPKQTQQAAAAKNKKQTTPSRARTTEHGTLSPRIFYANGTLCVNDMTYDLAKVQAGTFTMGATTEMKEASIDEKTTHQITITKSYLIGKTEVTQSLWTAIMGYNPSYFKGDQKPVENISWYECIAFISKLNDISGKKIRLPTEAEWEYAARGGNKNNHYQFCGGNVLENVAWFDGNSDQTTQNVAKKQPNELGLYDMSRNVREWCSDWYSSYSSYSQTDPQGPINGTQRVTRGGSWYDNAGECRSSFRFCSSPNSGNMFIGFRLVLSE